MVNFIVGQLWIRLVVRESFLGCTDKIRVEKLLDGRASGAYP